MISTEEVKKILQLKKTELNQEKQQMGLIVKQGLIHADNKTEPNKNLVLDVASKPQTPPTYQKTEIGRNNDSRSGLEDQESPRTSPMPPEVARYMRRHAGIPTAMLKTGEYSPNHPLLLRQTDTSGGVFLGFGEYEEQKKKLRKLRQQEYREYLDRQSKQRQQQNARLQAEDKRSDNADQNYRSIRYSDSAIEIQNIYAKRNESKKNNDKQNIDQSNFSKENSSRASYAFDERSYGDQNNVQISTKTVDSTTQCDDLGYSGGRKPSSVAVQTDESEFDKLSENFKVRRSSETNMQAERELSPRTVMGSDTLMVALAHSPRNNNHGWRERHDGLSKKEQYSHTNNENIKDGGYSLNHGVSQSKDECYERRNSPRSKLLQELRHSYMPSILDADVIQRRNLRAEQEAAAKRESYQQELRNQIVEQQRIKEERKAREKLLEQAEMRRLEQQLRTLQLAQDSEREKQDKITSDIRENNKQYLKESKNLQDEIVAESKNLQRAKSHTNTRTQAGNATAKTSTSDNDKATKPSNLPLYYAYRPMRRANEHRNATNERTTKLPFSTNIPDTSLFSPKYKSNYLSINNVPYRSNPKYGYEKEIRGIEFDRDNRNEMDSNSYKLRNNEKNNSRNEKLVDIIDFARQNGNDNENLVNSKGNKKGLTNNALSVSEYKPSFIDKDISELIVRRKSDFDLDSLPIPVLRHSLNNLNKNSEENNSDVVLGEKVNELSDAMKKVERKWQIPIVQKNIVRSVPDVDGKSKNGSILTQLGSIRRQLQMEQLKLDKMLAKND